MLNPKEELQLPIYFYLEPEILDDSVLENTKDIIVVYRFFKAKKQNVAELVDEENKRIEKNQKILEEMRKVKKGEIKIGEITSEEGETDAKEIQKLILSRTSKI